MNSFNFLNNHGGRLYIGWHGHALDKCVHSGGHLWPFITPHNGLYGEAPCGRGNRFLGFRYKKG